jgi:hypothetical protein
MQTTRITTGMLKEKQPELDPKPLSLQEGLDYYIENGYFVFTAYYLKKRGTCCGSGCRNCPYGKLIVVS